MSELILRQSLPVPEPKEPIQIRIATNEDIAFIDSLQKKYNKNLGFMPTKALEGKIKQQQILIAEERRTTDDTDFTDEIQSVQSVKSVVIPLGYLIGQDQYFKRDDVGIIYQIAVVEGNQRGFIGASLLKAQFDRSAYGCKLYCCWCAQDLIANQFWESMGFVPLAYRAGSEKKSRIHIFWQKRIRSDDQTTAWWYPSETKGGSMMADRLVLPIPPGVHWSTIERVILPQDTHEVREISTDVNREKKSSITTQRLADSPKTKATEKKVQSPLRGLSFARPEAAKLKPDKKPREKKPKVKNNPMHVSAARELRDRYLEKVNQNPLAIEASGKYDLTREISTRVPENRLLAA